MHPPRPLVLVLIGLLLLSSGAFGASGIGSTLEDVLADKGQPTGRSGAGVTTILAYPDETVVLKNGRVTEIRPNGEVSTVPDRKLTDAEKRRVAADNAAAAARATASAHTTAAGWTTDYEAALASAGGSGRKVFLFFTGSDWCGWCKKLQREILTTPEFAAYAADHLILVEIDFPRATPLEPEIRQRNEKLAAHYGIRGFPTVVVLDARGKVIGQLGYQAGGPTPFVERLRQL